MASDVVLKTIYKAVDKVSAPLKAMQRASKGFGQKTQLAMAKAERAVRKLMSPLDRMAKKFGKFALIAGGISIGAAFTAGANAFVDLDKNLSAAAAKFGIFDRASDSFRALKETAVDVGATTEFTSGQAAEGLNFLAMAGFSAEQAIASLPGVIDLATASQTDLAAASDIASDTLGAFNLMTKDSAQLGKNLSRVNDVMAKTTSMANTNMEQMFETIVKGGPDATAAGASIETYAALVAGLAGAGKKGSEAGTTLKNMFLKLQAPSAKGASMMKKMGLRIADSEGNMRDIIDVLEDLDKATAKMGGVEKSQIMDELFGKRAITGATALMALGTDELRKYRSELEKSTGISKKMAGFMRSGLSGAIAAMKSAFEAVAITIGDTFQPEIDKLIEGLTGVARGSGAWLKEHKPLIKFVFKAAKYVLYYFAAVKALSIIIKTWNLVTKIATAVQWAINAAMAANPIGLIIIGVAALILGLIMLVKHWDKVSAKMRQWRESAVFQIMSIMVPILKVIDMIAYLSDRWKAIKKAFREGGFLEGIKAIGKAILSFMLKPIEVLLQTISKIPKVGDFVKPALDKLENFRMGLDEGMVETGSDTDQEKGPVNIPAAQTQVEVQRMEEIQQQKLGIELTNKTDKNADVKYNPAMIPVVTKTR
jgi:TP901 family phage tail tape measure protein